MFHFPGQNVNLGRKCQFEEPKSAHSITEKTSPPTASGATENFPFPEMEIQNYPGYPFHSQPDIRKKSLNRQIVGRETFAPCQEAQNTLFCPSQEKFHTVVSSKGVRNISGAR